MPRLSEKYIAGFLDADGSIMMKRSGANKQMVSLSFSQKTSQDKVLWLIQKSLDAGYIRIKTIKNVEYSELCIVGKKAEMALNRIKQHLVIKKRYADCILDAIFRWTPKNNELIKAWLKAERKVRSLPLPNQPSRKWLAGYIDGDGSFVPSVRYKGAAEFKLSIGAWKYDTEGIELIQKVFGGKINRHGENTKLLAIGLPPSKAKQILPYFMKYLIVKKDQAYFILGCAEMGHYRDGENIKSAMKQLKAHPHRLSESEVDVISMIKKVRDLPYHAKNRPMRQSVIQSK